MGRKVERGEGGRGWGGGRGRGGEIVMGDA